jgi:hypothetical protein
LALSVYTVARVKKPANPSLFGAAKTRLEGTMGQVIRIDFEARKVTTDPATTATAPCVSTGGSEIPQVEPIYRREDPQSTTNSSASRPVERPATPVAVRTKSNSRPPKSLVESCAEMRAQSQALVAAIEDLKRASAELADLPRLTRELCEAAV